MARQAAQTLNAETPGKTPERTTAMFMQDITRFAATKVAATPTGLSQGLIDGTLVETASGWQPVETLRVGDSVYTLDGGLRRVVALNRREVLPGEPVVQIAGGHLDASSDVMLMPGQGVLLDTVGLMAAPYARVSATTLTACVGATATASPRRAEVVTPIFAEEEVVWAQSGLLLLCPGVRGGETAFPELHARAASLFLTERTRRFA